MKTERHVGEETFWPGVRGVPYSREPLMEDVETSGISGMDGWDVLVSQPPGTALKNDDIL